MSLVQATYVCVCTSTPDAYIRLGLRCACMYQREEQLLRTAAVAPHTMSCASNDIHHLQCSSTTLDWLSTMPAQTRKHLPLLSWPLVLLKQRERESAGAHTPAPEKSLRHTYLNVAPFERRWCACTPKLILSPSPYQCRPGGERKSDLHAKRLGCVEDQARRGLG